MSNSTVLEKGNSELSYRKPTVVDDLPQDQWLALFDLDGTLTIPGAKLVLEHFIFNDNFVVGIPERRMELQKVFVQWNKECDETPALITPRRYEAHLGRAGDLFAKMCHSLHRENVIEHAEKWFKKDGHALLMPYAGEVIQEVTKAQLCPVLVTGAPFELAYWFANHLGIRHLFAMEAEVNPTDVYTGEMKKAKNMGFNANKVRTRVAISRAGRPIAFAMGDTRSDTPLLRGAWESFHENDPRGRGILVNPTVAVREGMEAHFTEWISGGELTILPEDRTEGMVVRIVRDTIRDVIESNSHLLKKIGK